MENRLYKCTNVSFAAYLEQRGYKLARLQVERPGKGEFYFDVTTAQLNEVRCEWNNSPEAAFVDRLNRMKSLTY